MDGTGFSAWTAAARAQGRAARESGSPARAARDGGSTAPAMPRDAARLTALPLELQRRVLGGLEEDERARAATLSRSLRAAAEHDPAVGEALRLSLRTAPNGGGHIMFQAKRLRPWLRHVPGDHALAAGENILREKAAARREKLARLEGEILASPLELTELVKLCDFHYYPEALAHLSERAKTRLVDASEAPPRLGERVVGVHAEHIRTYHFGARMSLYNHIRAFSPALQSRMLGTLRREPDGLEVQRSLCAVALNATSLPEDAQRALVDRTLALSSPEYRFDAIACLGSNVRILAPELRRRLMAAVAEATDDRVRRPSDEPHLGPALANMARSLPDHAPADQRRLVETIFAYAPHDRYDGARDALNELWRHAPSFSAEMRGMLRNLPEADAAWMREHSARPLQGVASALGGLSPRKRGEIADAALARHGRRDLGPHGFLAVFSGNIGDSREYLDGTTRPWEKPGLASAMHALDPARRSAIAERVLAAAEDPSTVGYYCEAQPYRGKRISHSGLIALRHLAPHMREFPPDLQRRVRDAAFFMDPLRDVHAFGDSAEAFAPFAHEFAPDVQAEHHRTIHYGQDRGYASRSSTTDSAFAAFLRAMSKADPVRARALLATMREGIARGPIARARAEEDADD